ncbi:unnamed protein product [Tenebrio molitor]|nr:unnamed protein product [Tenebrio molitor]
MAIVAISNGPLLGVFTVGLLFPRVRAKGAFYGAIAGLICISRQILSVSGTDKRHYQTTFY